MAVIGAGSAGLSVTYAAARLGVRVALIERDRMGGDCLNHGCVPSKALLAAAHAARSARRAARFGVHLPPPDVAWTGVRAHVDGAIAAIAPMDSAERYRDLGATVLRGQARFVDASTLDVDGRRVTARRIVVAAGSSAAVPAIPGLDRVPYLTNATLFALPERPEHLLILGGGPVGLEMAQAHAALGSRVTLLERGRIGGGADPVLVDALRGALRDDGVELMEGVQVEAVDPGPAVVLADGRRVAGSHLLIAAGRAPNLHGLGLEAAGTQATAQGVATDRGLRSLSRRHVFAAGDIADPAGIGPRYLTHVGSYHAGLIVRRALFRLPARIDYSALPRVVFTDPELAQAGLTGAEARAAGHAPRLVRWPMAENDRAIAEGRTEGGVSLVVSAQGALLGVTILAPGAGETIGMWALALGRGVPLSALAATVLPYPTLSEAGKRAAASLFTDRLFAPRTRRLVRLLGRLP